MSYFDNAHFIQNPTIYQANLFNNPNNKQIPQVDYEIQQQLPITQQQFEQKQIPLENRRAFLLQFYKVQIISLVIILITLLLGKFDNFLLIVTDFQYTYLPEYFYTYEEFKNSIGVQYSQYEFEKWRLNQIKLTTSYSNIYYVIMSAFVILSILIIVGRNNRQWVSFQKIILVSQTLLFTLTLLGYLGDYRQLYYSYHDRLNIIIIIVSLFLINSIVNIVLIKTKLLYCYSIFSRTLTLLTVILNLIYFFLFYRVQTMLIEYEILIVYSFYYHNQLNYSLLRNPSEIENRQCICQKAQIPLINKDTPESNQNLSDRRKQIIKALILFFLICLILSLFGSLIFLVILIVFTILLFAIIIDTQVASKTLQETDYYYGVSISYIDFLFFVKNLLRSGGF